MSVTIHPLHQYQSRASRDRWHAATALLRPFPLRLRLLADLRRLLRATGSTRAALAWTDALARDFPIIHLALDLDGRYEVPWVSLGSAFLACDGEKVWAVLGEGDWPESGLESVRGSLVGCLGGLADIPPYADRDDGIDTLLVRAAREFTVSGFCARPEFVRSLVRAYGPLVSKSSEPRLFAAVMRGHLELPRLGGAMLEAGEALETRHGRTDLGETLARCAYEFAIRYVDPELGARASWVNARNLRLQGRWKEAARWYDQAALLAEDVRDFSLLARTIEGRGNVYREKGNLPAAQDRYREALGVAKVSGDRTSIASAHAALTGIAIDLGPARDVIEHALAGLEADGGGETSAAIYAMLGDFLARREAWDLALECTDRALRAAELRTDHRLVLEANRAEVLARMGCDPEAWDQLRRLPLLSSPRVSAHAAVQMHVSAGRALRELGEERRAGRLLRRAMKHAERFGIHEWAMKLDQPDGVGPAARPLPRSLIAHAREGLQAISSR